MFEESGTRTSRAHRSRGPWRSTGRRRHSVRTASVLLPGHPWLGCKSLVKHPAGTSKFFASQHHPLKTNQTQLQQSMELGGRGGPHEGEGRNLNVIGPITWTSPPRLLPDPHPPSSQFSPFSSDKSRQPDLPALVTASECLVFFWSMFVISSFEAYLPPPEMRCPRSPSAG